MCLLLMACQERSQKENVDEICRAFGYELGSELQVLQNILKSGETCFPYESG